MRTLLFTILAVLALNVSAATVTVVTINETTSARVDSLFVNAGMTDVDLTTGLEWLDFTTLINGEKTNLTMGHSVDSAIAAYSPQGFRLPTFTEITGLFNLFFPTFVDSGDGSMPLYDTVANANDALIQERNSWLMSFGTAINRNDGNLESIGFYVDALGNVQELGIDLFVNPLPISSNIYGLDYAEWTTSRTDAFLNRGVFMVRDFTVVPIPAAIWLFGSGLIGMLFVARRKL